MKAVFGVLIVAAVIVMTAAILLQASGASLGSAFGGESNFYRSKRGVEKILFRLTVGAAVVFVVSVILSLLSRR